MPDHKRISEARSTAFKRPRCECLACYDSGLLSDADGLLSAILSDYDRNDAGCRIPGSDLALICHCAAAFPAVGRDGATTRGGYRLSSGDLLVVDTDRGRQPVGAQLDRDTTRNLHRARLAQWTETETAMTQARTQQQALDVMAHARTLIRPVSPDPCAW